MAEYFALSFLVSRGIYEVTPSPWQRESFVKVFTKIDRSLKVLELQEPHSGVMEPS